MSPEQASYMEGYHAGIDSVMSDINDAMFDHTKFNKHELEAIRKLYGLLTDKHPERL